MGHIREILTATYQGKPLSDTSNSRFETVCVTCVALTRFI